MAVVVWWLHIQSGQSCGVESCVLVGCEPGQDCPDFICSHQRTTYILRSYDRASLQFLVNKTNRRTEFQFYWYYDSFGQSFFPSSGVLSRKSALVHFMQFWWPFATRSRKELQFLPAPASKGSSNLHKVYQCRCTAKNFWWWAERLPETCRVVIPIKLEFSASVGFIHKKQLSCRINTFTASVDLSRSKFSIARAPLFQLKSAT